MTVLKLFIFLWVFLGAISLYDMYLSSLEEKDNPFKAQAESNLVSTHLLIILAGAIGGLFWVIIWFILKDDFKK